MIIVVWKWFDIVLVRYGIWNYELRYGLEVRYFDMMSYDKSIFNFSFDKVDYIEIKPALKLHTTFFQTFPLI